MGWIMGERQYWIEVISGFWRLEQRVETTDGIFAPNTTRYRNQMRGLKKGDIVLTYAASYCMPTHYRRKIVGLSVAYEVKNTPSTIRLISTPLIMLPEQIPFSELKQLNGLSADAEKLLQSCMQRYFTRLTESDVNMIFESHPASKKFLMSEIEKATSSIQ